MNTQIKRLPERLIGPLVADISPLKEAYKKLQVLNRLAADIPECWRLPDSLNGPNNPLSAECRKIIHNFERTLVGVTNEANLQILDLAHDIILGIQGLNAHKDNIFSVTLNSLKSEIRKLRDNPDSFNQHGNSLEDLFGDVFNILGQFEYYGRNLTFEPSIPTINQARSSIHAIVERITMTGDLPDGDEMDIPSVFETTFEVFLNFPYLFSVKQVVGLLLDYPIIREMDWDSLIELRDLVEEELAKLITLAPK